MQVIGMSSAAEAVSTPLSDVWMTREGEAPTCRSQARKGANDNGHIAEEPCEGKLSRTVLKQRRGSDSLADCNRPGRQRRFAAQWPSQRSVVVLPLERNLR
jgi:hypothetical protein